MAKPRVLAFYLPQFHPIPENDAWWGRGFTEWSSVARVRSQHRSHEQPRLPADLGFYDLRLPEARAAQAALAAQFGIDGFVYYHYWFNGRRLLNRPFDDVRRSGQPDFPFCLCWANEAWTRAWDGRSGEVLVEQTHSPEDDLAHARWLASQFSDPRYIRRDDRPLFLVYRASRLPDPVRTTDCWRRETERLTGVEPYLARVESHAEERDDPSALGFDCAVEFQPDWVRLPDRLLPPRPARRLMRLARLQSFYLRNRVYEYGSLVELALGRQEPPYELLRCVTPGWDNSPRRSDGGATVFVGSTPARYQAWLHGVLERSAGVGAPYVFVNAWNEWGEGALLEPDDRHGSAYLEATRAAIATLAPSS